MHHEGIDHFGFGRFIGSDAFQLTPYLTYELYNVMKLTLASDSHLKKLLFELIATFDAEILKFVSKPRKLNIMAHGEAETSSGMHCF